MTKSNREERPRVVTQRDVARAAGVDRATVSRALDPKKRLLISTETLERVLKAAEELNYRTNVLARGLRTSRSGIVGLAVPSIKSNVGSPFDKTLGIFISSLEERLAREDMTLLVTFDSDDPMRNPTDRFTRSGMVDGLIRIQSRATKPTDGTEGLPLVRVGFEVDPSYDVVIDDARGIELGVEHLDRFGHRRIGLISEPQSHPRGNLHSRTFRAAMERLGLLDAGEEPLMSFFHTRHPASAPEAVASLLQRAPDLTALFFTDDKAAMSGYGNLRARRIRLPQDISILGWGDSEAGLFLMPPLTTIAPPVRAAAFAAGDALIERISTNTRPADSAQRVFSPFLIQRASTAAAARWER